MTKRGEARQETKGLSGQDQISLPVDAVLLCPCAGSSGTSPQYPTGSRVSETVRCVHHACSSCYGIYRYDIQYGSSALKGVLPGIVQGGHFSFVLQHNFTHSTIFDCAVHVLNSKGLNACRFQQAFHEMDIDDRYRSNTLRRTFSVPSFAERSTEILACISDFSCEQQDYQHG